MESGDIHLTGYTSWKFAKSVNVKNVFTGFWTSRNKSVILKKLGYDSELDDLDGKLCVSVDEKTDCDIRTAVENLTKKLLTKDEVIDLDSLSSILLKVNHTQDWLGCADQNLVNYIVKESLSHSSKPALENILTMILINQEPLLAMTFADKQLPITDYLGACGRMAVFTDAGTSLRKLSVLSPWRVRSSISYELLMMIKEFSVSNHLTLYPTDWDPNHFCVDKSTGSVKLVDLENIVIVNTSIIQHSSSHKSDNLGCDEKKQCYSYSIPQLCQHRKSDHNIFGICSNILSPSPFSLNLLRDAPDQITSKFRSFPGLLDICWKGGQPSRKDARWKAARNIEKILFDEDTADENIF